jgi:hypothetical protein
MRLRPPVFFLLLLIGLLGSNAFADQIVLKDGTVYSGKFVRGDAQEVHFRVLGRTEVFKISDVSQITFKEPELNVPAARTITPQAPAQPTTPATPQVERKTPPVIRQASTPRNSSTPPPAKPADSNPSDAEESADLRTFSASDSQSDSDMILPAGTPIIVRTFTDIDTDRNRVGDVFEASLDQPLVWGNKTVAPKGSTVKGRIAYAKESGKLSGQSQMLLELTDLTVNGKNYMLRTNDYKEIGSNRANRTAATVGGTAALGAIIGAIAGGGTGAAVGAASGAAVGTGVQVMTRGQVLRIPAETILEFRLQSPLTINE